MPPQNSQNPQNPYNQTPPPPIPQGYAPPAAPSQPPSTPYDFFMAQQQKPKRGLLPKNSSGFTKLIIGTAALFVVLIAVAVVLNISRNSQKTTTPGFTSVVQSQQEIIRVSQLGTASLAAANLQNFAVTAIAATTSSQQKTISFVQSSGGVINTTALAAADNKQTDQTLTQALSTNTYDATFKSLMQQQLTNYEGTLQQVHDHSTVFSQRNILDSDLSSAQLLVKMLNE